METSPQATMALYYYTDYTLKEIRSRFGREDMTLLKNTNKSPNSSEMRLLVGTTRHNNILLWRIWMDRHLRAVFVATSTPYLLSKTPLKDATHGKTQEKQRHLKRKLATPLIPFKLKKQPIMDPLQQLTEKNNLIDCGQGAQQKRDKLQLFFVSAA